jgi:CRISPR/Cas system-associated protein Cas5 (RAMP superfamily)
MYKNKYLKYKKKYNSFKACLNGGSDTNNKEHINILTGQIESILNFLEKKVDEYKIRNSALKSNPTKNSDKELSALLTVLEFILKTQLRSTNSLKVSHMTIWDNKIKRLGSSGNYDSLTDLEKSKYDEMNQEEQRRDEIRRYQGPDKNMVGYI